MNFNSILISLIKQQCFRNHKVASSSVFISKSLSGCGLGAFLCKHIVKAAKDMGYNVMKLDTLERLPGDLWVFLYSNTENFQPPNFILFYFIYLFELIYAIFLFRQ